MAVNRHITGTVHQGGNFTAGKIPMTTLLKTSHFRPLHKNQINADPPHWSEVIFYNPLNNEIRFILHWNQIKSDPPHCNQGDLDHHTKSKSICMLRLKASDFRPCFKNQVNFDHPHNNQISFIPTLKSSQIRSPALKSSQNGPPTRKTSQFSCL